MPYAEIFSLSKETQFYKLLFPAASNKDKPERRILLLENIFLFCFAYGKELCCAVVAGKDTMTTERKMRI